MSSNAAVPNAPYTLNNSVEFNLSDSTTAAQTLLSCLLPSGIKHQFIHIYFNSSKILNVKTLAESTAVGENGRRSFADIT
jgi:tRNA nucleotidyltransferase/poly(A) polymerase